jgi:hypothetical protein
VCPDRRAARLRAFHMPVHNADLAAVFEKAQKLGVPTVEEKEFLKLLER